MDIEVLGLDSLVGPTTTKPLETAVLKTKQPETDKDGDLKKSKLQRSYETYCVSNKSLQQQEEGSSLLRSNCNSMLQENFKHEASSIFGKDCAFPYIRSAGYGIGSLNSMHESFNEARGPFTPYQWMELEHQALIYKYISANAPVPSNLLVPINRSLYQYSLPAASSAYISLGSLGGGGFQLCYTGNSNDPEPGRCRRTDGKKWRCSRDAVPDQKYCERHINRGRHRSRKHVEGQNGHASAGTSSTKGVPVTSSMSTLVVTATDGASKHIPLQQHLKNLHPTTTMDSTDAYINRDQDPRGVSVVSSATFSIPKQEIPVKESCSSEFGLVSSDSLLNPSHRNTYLQSDNSELYINFSNDHDNCGNHCLRHVIDDWPKNQSSRTTISWPDELNSDRTQLSMSIPLTMSNFSSSSSSPTQEKLALSPMMVSHEFDPIHMGLEATNDVTESIQKQANWIPISWGTSIGGPLAEVLTTSTANTSSCKSSTSLNLSAKGWNTSQHFESSPTAVLQKSTFGSLSSSSSGSSQK